MGAQDESPTARQDKVSGNLYILRDPSPMLLRAPDTIHRKMYNTLRDPIPGVQVGFVCSKMEPQSKNNTGTGMSAGTFMDCEYHPL